MNNYRKKNLIELIKSAQNDDDKALDEIVRRYQSKIYNVFCKLSPDYDLSDLTQLTLIKMSKSIKMLKDPQKFNAWLYKIIHNIFYDIVRRNKIKNAISTTNSILQDKEGEFGECVIDRNKTPVENTLACELKQKISKAIEELPPLFKTIILLREIDELSYEEISDITGLKINTIKSRLARARIKLQKELQEYIN